MMMLLTHSEIKFEKKDSLAVTSAEELLSTRSDGYLSYRQMKHIKAIYWDYLPLHIAIHHFAFHLDSF